MTGEFRFHHFGIAVKDIAKALPTYETLFGYRLISQVFDDPIQQVSVCFLSRGDVDPALELVAPLGEDSPIERVLRKGGGPYHICYEVEDMDSAIRSLIENGCFLVSGPVPAVAFAMRPIAWLVTPAELLVELVQR